MKLLAIVIALCMSTIVMAFMVFTGYFFIPPSIYASLPIPMLLVVGAIGILPFAWAFSSSHRPWVVIAYSICWPLPAYAVLFALAVRP